MSDAVVVRPRRWAAAQADAVLSQMDKAATTPGSLAPYRERAGSAAMHLGVAATVAVALGAADAAFGPEPGGFSTDGALAIGALLTAVVTSGAASDVALTNGVMLSGMYLRRKTAELMRAGRDESAPDQRQPAAPDEDPVVAYEKAHKKT